MLRRPSGAVSTYGILFVAASSIMVLTILVIIPYLTKASSQNAASQRRLIEVDLRSILHSSIDSITNQTVTTYEDSYGFHYIKAGDLNPNTSVGVLYPFNNVVDTLYQNY